MENKKKKKTLIFVLVIIGLALFVYIHSLHISPTHFTLEKATYIHSTIPEGFDQFKIAFISDFDLKTNDDLDYLEKCMDKINKEACDMVIFGGDLYETSDHFDTERLVSILKGLTVPSGKLAVLGENEIKSNTDECIQILENGGFEVMRNQAHYIYSNEDKIVFAGLENNGKVDELLSEDMKNHFILSVVHQPDYFLDIQHSSSLLQLSGHSAGGFISLPLIGGLITTEGAKTYVSGKEVINDHTLYISNGIGLGHDQKARFLCNPDALIITLRTSN